MAKPNAVTFTRGKDAKRIAAATRSSEGDRSNTAPTIRGPRIANRVARPVLIVTSTISARSGTTPGSGTVSVVERQSGVLTATQTGLTCYSIITSTIAVGKYGYGSWDGNGDLYGEFEC